MPATIAYSEKQLEELENRIIESGFNYYRNGGFPYIKMEEHEILFEFLKLVKEDSSINKHKGMFGEELVIEGSGTGLNSCFSIMKHEYKVKCSGSSCSPMEAYQDDKKLELAVKLHVRYARKFKKFNDTAVRNYLCLVKGSQLATNFKPFVAKSIYDYFLKDGDWAYDFSSGFGGRLYGFLASNYLRKEKCRYYAVEPASRTFDCLNEMRRIIPGGRYTLIFKRCAEDFCPSRLKGKFGLSFSSPPYFNKEAYSNERTQSYRRHPTYSKWKSEFLRRLILNSYFLLKRGGKFILNIDDVYIKGKKIPLLKDSKEICEEVFGRRRGSIKVFMPRFGKSLDKKNYENFMVYEK